MTPDPTSNTHAQLAEFLRIHPDTSAIEAVAHVGGDPSRWVDPVRDALEADTPHTALATPDADADPDREELDVDDDGTDTDRAPEHVEEDTAPDRSTPGVDVEKAGSATPEPADDTDFNQQPTPEDRPVLVNDADGRTDAEPTPGEDALADGFRWFADQLDRELPDAVDHDTPRDYYHARGWSDATIDAKGLGFAPADTGDRLLAHLHRKGHDRNAILASGLFREWDDGNLSATWTGRYVLPYLDADGRPVFAISRATEPAHPSDWAGRYGEDDDPAKYHKIAVSREEVTVEEPIYGLDTVRDGEPVLITEGIADAIAAHQAGYPCLSPVTTSFKTEDRERLVDALEEYAVPRVYLVQDAERPGSSVDDRDRLTLPQHGEGTKGAVRTGEYLAEHGVDARIGDLPRPGLDKVDLDDYLRGWSDDLAPILAGATPVDQHPAHDPDAAKRAAIDAAERADLSGSPASGSGAGSALFDLDITDVTGLGWDYRGPSPLGHHGNTENYFVMWEDKGLAFDHKHKAAYNALTYLLADAGERPPARPNGSVDDAELLAAWVHAKRERLLAEDDPIPRRALRAIARDATGWDGKLVEHETADGDTFDGLPRDAYNDALDAVREEYDLEPGRRPVDGEGTAQAQYPIETCKPPTHDPDTFDRRERWDDLQGDRYDAVLEHAGVSIWNDPAGSGKTTNAALAALLRDRNVALLFDKHEKAREAQTDDALPDWFDPYHLKGAEQKRHARCMDADHAGETCSEHGHTENCPSMCPVKDLDPDHETRRRYDAVAREVGDVRAHLLLADDLPGHDDDGRCKWVDQFEEVDAADHVVGVHEYQRLKTVRDGRDVIVDESPSSLRETTHVDIEGLARTASALDDLANVLPRDDATQHTARAFAGFVDDLVDAVTRDATLADLDAPRVIWNAYESYDDAAGNYVEREEPTEEWHTAEALAQLKVAYAETILNRIKREEWDGTPVGLDAVITAAGEAGLSSDAVRTAVAAPTVLDSCPWCNSPLESHNGARICGSDACDWSEHGHTITQRGAERARALAYLDGGPAGVRFEQLPLTSDLPSDPLVLDATATPSRVALLYGADSDAVEVSGADDLRANMRVTQVLDGQYHANTIEKGDIARERIQTTIDKAGEIHEKPLFVLKKSLRELFNFPAHAEILHYHAARGLNRNDCDAVVCIGAPHPNVPDLKREAELLAQGTDTRIGGEEHSTRRDAPNPPVYRTLNFEDDDGRGRAVPTKHYTGLVGDLFRETREKEIQQDIHRARPLLAEETVDVYLLTNVPTNVRVDTVCSFEELAEPLQALLPIRDGALEFLGTIERVAAGDGPDGFRAEQLVETTADGTLSHKVGEYHRLARLVGLDVTERTVRNYIDDLEAVGLLKAEAYEQRAGVSYTADRSTLKTALSILTNNAGFKVAARRRLRANIDKAESVTEWLDWAQAVFELGGDRCDLEPPPETAV